MGSLRMIILERLYINMACILLLIKMSVRGSAALPIPIGEFSKGMSKYSYMSNEGIN